MQGLTPSEQFVTQLCGRSFLTLWTHPNPIGKKGKELCDCLIVCGDHIVIISVKEIEYKDTGDKVGWWRWTKAAITKSVSQIMGAERWLETQDDFVRHDGRVVTLSPKGSRKYHRVSVSLGADRNIPLAFGDHDGGFVHVCDEHSVDVLFEVLDTIIDFVNFLSKSEYLLSNNSIIFNGGGIEDLLGLYLSHGRSFHITDEGSPSSAMIILEDDIWKDVSKSDDFKKMMSDLSSSYIWDRLIEYYAEDLLTDGMFDMHSKAVTKNELALITMAMQSRGHRANLAESFIEFLNKPGLKVASRVIRGDNNTAFVFLIGASSDREIRSKELMLRSLVVRGRLPNIITVVGIATDRPGTSKVGYSSDIAYLHIPEWTTEHEESVKGIQNEFGYFSNAQWKNIRHE